MTQPLQLELDRSAKTPLAEQIRKGISAAIESGVFAPGARLSSEAIDDPKKTVAGSGEMLLRGRRDPEQQTGSRMRCRRVPKRQRCGGQPERQHFPSDGLIGCAIRQS